MHGERCIEEPNRCAHVPDPVEVATHFTLGCAARGRRILPPVHTTAVTAFRADEPYPQGSGRGSPRPALRVLTSILLRTQAGRPAFAGEPRPCVRRSFRHAPGARRNTSRLSRDAFHDALPRILCRTSQAALLRLISTYLFQNTSRFRLLRGAAAPIFFPPSRNKEPFDEELSRK